MKNVFKRVEDLPSPILDDLLVAYVRVGNSGWLDRYEARYGKWQLVNRVYPAFTD